MAEKRFHIVEGFIKAIDVLDEIIKTIRESKSKKDANVNLINNFGFTEMQAEAILELMLYRLTGLEIKVFQKEYAELEKTIKRLKKILSEERELLKVVKNELQEVSEKYGTPRKTAIIKDDSEAKIDVEELIIVEDVMITLSKDGFIKRIPMKTYNRLNAKPEDIEYREGDELKFLFNSNTTENILLFTNKGNMYQTKGINIPEAKWKDKGERIDSIIKALSLEEESLVYATSLGNFMPNKYIQFITSKGGIKKSSLDKFQTNYSKLQALKLKESEEVVDVVILNEDEKRDFISFETKEGLNFNIQIPNIEDSPRNILPMSMFNLTSKDEVVKVEYKDSMEFIGFSIGVTAKGNIRAFSSIKKNDNLKVSTNSLSNILLFTNIGKVFKVPAFLLSGVNKGEIPLNKIIDNLEKGEKIIKLLSINSFENNNFIYFFTKRGMVKKTALKEFDGSYLAQASYKFKYDNDELISIDMYNEDDVEMIIITKKGMAIKFLSSNINAMGKIASGVTGISLKEGDEVIYGKLIGIENINTLSEMALTSSDKITLVSKNKERKELYLEEVKLQNRAGKGSSIMTIVLDDEIKEII